MNTRTANRPDLDEDRQQTSDHPTPPAPPALDLSMTQVVAGSLAAATAAALGSRLGVVGTISGAALVSVVASVAGALYTTSLQRTRDRMSRAIGTVVRDPLPRVARPRPGLVLVGAALVFALAATGVTAVEMLTGRSMDGRSGSTTVATTLHQPAAKPSRQTTPTPSDVPSETASTTPSPSPTSSPTSGESVSPTGEPTADVPSPTVTDPAEPSATPSGSPTPSGQPSEPTSPSATPTDPATSWPVAP
jgi:hypothetical protein